MKDQLFIPSRIKVGYQKRDDTYTKKLAYIIYYDNKGVLRKQVSWEGWRHKDIDPEEFDNTPTSGFILNKGVQRYGDWFSSGRSMIRVYDPRGIEFEVTIDNLIGILMNTNCNKRGLDGDFVYAWYGKELILLPTCSEEYQKSVNYTSLQSKKISAKELILGASYKTKTEKDYIYLGRFLWYTFDYNRYESRVPKKYHIFTTDGKSFLTKSSCEFLAAVNNTEPVINYAELVESFQNCIHSSKIVNFEIVPKQYTFEELTKTAYAYHYDVQTTAFSIENGFINQYAIHATFQYHAGAEKEFLGYYRHAYLRLQIDNQTFVDTLHSYPDGEINRNGYNWYREPTKIDLNVLNSFGLGELWVTLENGKKVKVENLKNL